jgi:hypothetical protein
VLETGVAATIEGDKGRACLTERLLWVVYGREADGGYDVRITYPFTAPCKTESPNRLLGKSDRLSPSQIEKL